MGTIYPIGSPLIPPLLGVKVTPKGIIDLYVSSEKYQKMEVAKIIECSKGYLVQARQNNIDSTEGITSGGLRKIEQQSSDIIHYTDLIIQAKQAQRKASKLARMITLVFCAIGSIVLVGIPFLILIRRDDRAFKKEMQSLQDNVQAMKNEREEILGTHEKLLRGLDLHIPEEFISKIVRLKGTAAKFIDQIHDLNAQVEEIASQDPVNEQKLNELKNKRAEVREQLASYIYGIQTGMEELGLPFEEAVKYVQVREHFNRVEMGKFQSLEFAEQIKSEISTVLNAQLPRASAHFVSDIDRGVSFELDHISYPIPQDQAKAKSAAGENVETPAQAIASFVEDGNEDWIPILQVAVTQTNLNGAFGEPRVVLATGEGNLVSWREEGNEYVIQSEFSGRRLPPTKLEVTRNPTGRITEVRVSVEGDLDLVKKNIGGSSTQSGKTERADTVIVHGAFSASLSYALILSEGKLHIGNFEYECRANESVYNNR